MDPDQTRGLALCVTGEDGTGREQFPFTTHGTYNPVGTGSPGSTSTDRYRRGLGVYRNGKGFFEYNVSFVDSWLWENPEDSGKELRPSKFQHHSPSGRSRFGLSRDSYRVSWLAPL